MSTPPPPSSTRLWHGTARSTRDEERRRRLHAAALQLYGTIGFRATGVAALCKEARVSTRSFYELYNDQDQLLAELYRDLNAEVLAGLRDTAMNEGAPLADAVRAFVEAALTPMLEDERKARILEVEAVGVSDSLERERRLAYRGFADAIDEVFAMLAATGRVADPPAGLASLVLVGGITEALVQRVQSDPASRAPVGAFLDDLSTVIRRLLTGD